MPFLGCEVFDFDDIEVVLPCLENSVQGTDQFKERERDDKSI